MIAPLPDHEPDRLEALRRTCILDTPPEDAYDDLARLAAFVCNVPIALVSLVDEDRQWFKARVGLGVTETPRSVSFCAHAICGHQLFVVPDTLNDERFCSNPLVSGDPQIRFYAGMPITAPDGHNLGTLCVIDREPRQLSEASQMALRVLARQAAGLIHVRRQMAELQAAAERQAETEQQLRDSQERLRTANRRLEEMVRTDALTGLGNRRLFNERLRQEWKLSRRLGFPLSLLMVDLDHFKAINDRAGHTVGDAVLRHLGALLDSWTRETDTCTRYGGEEFAILLPATPLEQATRLANQLCRRVAETPCGEFCLTVSIGISSGIASDASMDPSWLLEKADAALYAAKAAGRNRVASAPA